MTRGYLIIAQSSANTDYIRMAYALALSISVSQRTVKSVSVAVTDPGSFPDQYRSAFDCVVQIPWGDDAADSEWKIENKWKYIHMSPYDETVVLDADMIITSPIDDWWNLLSTHDVFFTTNPLTYRGSVIASDAYRKTFTSNQLPNVYTAFMYFKKTPESYQLFELTCDIFRNWQKFYYEFLDETRPTRVSGDVCFALATKLLGKEHEFCTDVVPGFVHMKTMVQDIDSSGMTESWNEYLPTYFNTRCELKIGNFHQFLPFHYYMKDWLTDDIVATLESNAGRKL